MSILARSESSGNSGGVVQVIEPVEDERLLSYQIPPDSQAIGYRKGPTTCPEVIPAGRYTETAPIRANGWVWLEDENGDPWYSHAHSLQQYALDQEACTARQVARRKAYGRALALDWCERLLDLADQWPDVIDHLPCDDVTAEAIGDLLDQVVAKVKGVKA